MAYTDIFGGGAIYPSDVSYLAISLSADATLQWPLENNAAAYPAARVIDVSPTGAGFSVWLPDATLAAPGETILFNNVSASQSFTIKDAMGNVVATAPFGTQWQVYLASNAVTAGVWRTFRYGASTATVQASALAGFGLTVTGTALSQSAPVTTFNTSGITLSLVNRASLFVWNGTGSGTLNLPTVASAGNNFFAMVRNGGGGTLTIDPAGSELINGAATLPLMPGDSAIVVCDGASWYTVGFGQNAVFAFDYTTVALTGGTYTLSGSELNRIAYKFTGTLTSNVTVVIPSTIQQYWVTNATTGAYTLSIKTASGPAAFVNQGAHGIYYCDGLNVILASDPTTLSTPITISNGGTSATTPSAARLNLGITTFADPIVTATSGPAVLTVIGGAAAGANSDITSLNGLTTPLSVNQGGTGGNTAAAARVSLSAAQSGNNVDINSLAPSGLLVLAPASGIVVGSPAGGGLGAGSLNVVSLYVNGSPVTAANGTVTSINLAGGTTGLTFSGGPITTAGTITVDGTLAVANGGTGVTTIGGLQSALGLGTMASQNANAVNITGGTVANATLSGVTLSGSITSSASINGGSLIGATVAYSTINADCALSDSTIGGIAANAPGFRGLPPNAKTGAYTLALTDSGKMVNNTTGGWAIPANATVAFPVGATIVLYNDSSTAQTLSITSDTLRLAGTTATGTRNVAAFGMATLVKVQATVWSVSGPGVS